MIPGWSLQLGHRRIEGRNSFERFSGVKCQLSVQKHQIDVKFMVVTVPEKRFQTCRRQHSMCNKVVAVVGGGFTKEHPEVRKWCCFVLLCLSCGCDDLLLVISVLRGSTFVASEQQKTTRAAELRSNHCSK